MRIQIVMGFALPVPAVQGGAVEKRWHGLALELATRHSVTMYSRSHPALPAAESEGPLQHVRIPGFAWSNRRWLNSARSFAWSGRIARHLEPGDVLITNDVAAPLVLPRLRNNLGLVAIEVARMPKLQHRWLYRGVDRFYCTSSAVVERMTLIAPKAAQRSIVLPNSTDLDLFHPSEIEQTDAGRLEVLYIGRIHPEKSIDTLLRAWPLCKLRERLFLRIVGPAAQGSGGDASYADQLRQLASDLGLTAADWALDPPVFDDRKLAEIYRRATIFAYPSRAVSGETFGISVLEAMACGKPCLVSPLVCFRDLVQDGISGLVVDSWQPADWAAAIDRLASSPDLRRSLGERSRQVAEKFSPRQVALKLEDDLERLLSQRRSPIG